MTDFQSWKSLNICQKSWKSHGKWKYTTTKITFWPNIKCHFPCNILMHTDAPIICARLGTIKGPGNFHILYGKIMEFKGSKGAQTLTEEHFRPLAFGVIT